MYAYGVLAWNTDRRTWIFDAPGPVDKSDPRLVAILNYLGQNGWQVVAAGNFNQGEISEIILQKPT